jgi:PAS domain S-box-containing protein
VVLPESIRHFVQLQERSPMPFAVIGTDGQFLAGNKAFCDLIGYGIDELREMTWRDLTPPEASSIELEIRIRLATGQMPRYEKEYVRKDGARVPVEIFLSQLTDDRGRPQGYYAFIVDISDRKLNEARIEAQLELNEIADKPLQQIVDFALEKAICLTGSKIGYIGTISEDGKFMIVQNYSRQVMIECLTRENPLVFPIENGGIWTDAIIARKPTIVNDYEKPHPYKRGIPAGHVSLKRLINIPMIENGRVVAQIMLGNKEAPYDASDVRQLELFMSGIWRVIQRKKAEEALIYSRQQADLYVDLMGHDISNINQIALGYLELAREMLGLDDTKREFLDLSIKVLSRISRLIQNVRKLQKLNMGDIPMEIVDLGMALEKAQRDYSDVRDKRVVISYEMEPGIMVMANALLPDVFSNLIDNAISQAKGRDVEISISMSLVYRGSGWYHRVDVTDNGPGIADEHKSHVFSRRGPDAPGSEGSGIGLHLTRLLVESYGGKIWVEDRVPGNHKKGSRFIVMLPMVA